MLPLIKNRLKQIFKNEQQKIGLKYSNFIIIGERSEYFKSRGEGRAI